MKRFILGVYVLVIAFAVMGCQKAGLNKPQGVDEFVKGLKAYQTEVTADFYTSGIKTTLKMQQTYNEDGSYTLTIVEPEHMRGYITQWDGDKIEEYNPITDKKVQAQPHPVKNQVLFGTFVHNYLHGDNMSTILDEQDGSYTAELAIPGNYKYMAREKVWFDKKDTKPVKMEIYDKEGNTTIAISFLSFEIQ